MALAICTALVLATGMLGARLVAPTTASAAAPLSCGGSTIYSVDTKGNLYALNVKTGVNTLVTTWPSPGGANPNGMGVLPNGTAAYAVRAASNTIGPTVPIYRYDAATGTTATFAGTASPTTKQAFIMGGVDPTTGIFYYASPNTTRTALLLFGFDTKTNTAIPGTIAQIELAGPNLMNGDFAFDQLGNIYILEGDNSGTRKSAIVRVNGPLPQTGSQTPPTLGWAVLAEPPPTGSSDEVYNGVAFGPNGSLYAQYASHANPAAAELVEINPNTGATISTIAQSGQIATLNDLGSCTYTGTLQVRKDIVGRVHASDQFQLSITGSGVTGGNVGTTTGAATGPQTAAGEIAGPILGVPGAAYTVAETGAGSTDLALYRTAYECVNTTTGAQVASGTGPSTNLEFPQPVNSASGADVTCTFTNTPVAPTLRLTKALSAPRLQNSDQFTMQIRTGSPTGPVVNSLASTTTAGSGSTVFTGTGTTGTYTATAGTTYYLTEAAAGTTVLGAYAATITCTDANGAQTGLPDGAPFSGSFAITPVPGAAISCVLTNGAASPSLSLSKALGSPRVRSSDQFAMQVHTGSAGGPVVSDPANATTTGSGSTVTTGTGTTGAYTATAGTTYYLTEAGAGTTSLHTYTSSITCTDVNGVQRGLPSGASFDGSLEITPAPGASISCVLTNSAVPPTLSLRKELSGARVHDSDQFTMQIHAGSATGPVVSDTAHSTTTGGGSTVTAGTGTTGTYTAVAGTTYYLTEAAAGTTSLAHYHATITCTDANGVATGLPADSSFGGSLAITPVPGSAISCALMNTTIPAPSLMLTKALSSARVRSGDQFTMQIRSGSESGPVVSDPVYATTTGSGATVTAGTGTTGAYGVSVGTTYYLTEAGAGTTNLHAYTARLTCSDAAGLQTGLPVNEPFNGALAITPTVRGAELSCVLTNSAASPTLSLHKELGSARVHAGDQFTMQIHSGSATGPVVSSPVNATTAGSGSTVTAGTGTTGTYAATAGTTYDLTETAAGTTEVHTYTTTISCHDANGVETGLPSGAPFTGSLAITPAPGAAISCALTNSPTSPTLSLHKDLGSARVHASDQFTMQIRTGSATGPVVSSTSTATTTGGGSTVTAGTGTTGTYAATAGRAYHLTEAGAGTANLHAYTTTISCTDANGAQTGLPDGARFSGSLAITPVAGSAISCVLTNSAAAPTLSLHKELSGGRVDAGDQFTMQIHSGSATGPIVSDPANATTTGAGSTVTAGTGTTGTYAAAAGTTYYLTEAAAGTTSLGHYHATITCSDANGVATGLPTAAAFSGSLAITPVAGSAITCALMNTGIPAPSLMLTKALGSARVHSGDQFTMQIHSGSATGPVVSDPANATTSGSGSTVTAGTGTTGDYGVSVGTTYYLTEAGAGTTNLHAYTGQITCSDAAGLQTGLPVNAPFSGALAITLTVRGAEISCVLTNSAASPTLSLHKELGSARVQPGDQFTMQIHSGSATGPVVSSTSTATTTGSGSTVTVGTGTTGTYAATAGTTYYLTEAGAGTTSPHTYTSSITCTDVNGVQRGLPSGASFDGSLGITPVPGAAISCVVTNSAVSPTLSLHKELSGARVHDSDQFTMQIHAGSATGPVVSDTAHATTTGAGSTVTAGTGTTGTYSATAGTTYYLTEAAAGTTSLTHYDATITCRDANGIQTGLPDGARLSGSLAITPVPGAAISCTLTNDPNAIVPPPGPPGSPPGQPSDGHKPPSIVPGLPNTGSPPAFEPLPLGHLLILVGCLLDWLRRRRRQNQ